MKDFLCVPSLLTRSWDTYYPITSENFFDWDFMPKWHRSSHHPWHRHDLDPHIKFGQHFFSYDSCAVDASSSFWTRQKKSSVLSLHTSSLWPSSLTLWRESTEHHSIQEASDFFTYVVSSDRVLRAIWRQALSFSLEVQDLLLAAATTAVGIVPG